MEPYYEDDYATIYHGDCREVTEWLTADVLVTDPPYGMGYVSNFGKTPTEEIEGDLTTEARDDVLALWEQGGGPACARVRHVAAPEARRDPERHRVRQGRLARHGRPVDAVGTRARGHLRHG